MNTTNTRIKQIEKQIAKLQNELKLLKTKQRKFKVYWREDFGNPNVEGDMHVATVPAKNEKDAAIQFKKLGKNKAAIPGGVHGCEYGLVGYVITKIKAI